MKTATTLKIAGHLVLSSVWDVSAQQPIRPNDQGIWVDDNQPITLERMQKLYSFCCEVTGQQLGMIEINMSAYQYGPEVDEGPNPSIWEKQYRYDPEHALLTIHEDGEFVYEEQNGNVTRNMPIREKPEPAKSMIYRVRHWVEYGTHGVANGRTEEEEYFFLTRENAVAWIAPLTATDYDPDLFLGEWQENGFAIILGEEYARSQESYRILEIVTDDHKLSERNQPRLMLSADYADDGSSVRITYDDGAFETRYALSDGSFDMWDIYFRDANTGAIHQWQTDGAYAVEGGFAVL